MIIDKEQAFNALGFLSSLWWIIMFIMIIMIDDKIMIFASALFQKSIIWLSSIMIYDQNLRRRQDNWHMPVSIILSTS